MATRHLRADVGPLVGLQATLLLGDAQSSLQTQLLLSGVEHWWAVTETARTLDAGAFTVTLRIATAGPNLSLIHI